MCLEIKVTVYLYRGICCKNERHAGGLSGSGRQDFPVIRVAGYSRVLKKGCNVSTGFLKVHINPVSSRWMSP